MDIGIPLAQHRLAPYVAAPFGFTLEEKRTSGESCRMEEAGQHDARHPICQVLEWDRQLKSGIVSNKAQLAIREGLTKARMSQLFGLLQLGEDVQKYLVTLRGTAAIKSFSVRRLITLAQLPAARQVEEFAKLQSEEQRMAA